MAKKIGNRELLFLQKRLKKKLFSSTFDHNFLHCQLPDFILIRINV